MGCRRGYQPSDMLFALYRAAAQDRATQTEMHIMNMSITRAFDAIDLLRAHKAACWFAGEAVGHSLAMEH